jgi:hypothetical protein
VISARLIAAGVGLAALVALYFVGDARGAARIQARYDAFQFEQKLEADAQREMNHMLELAQDRDRVLLEAKNAQDVAAVHDRYAAEFERLRNTAGSAGADGVPAAGAAVDVCADAADNDRLSHALAGFRVGVRELLEQAEIQARTLMTCQNDLARVTSRPLEPPRTSFIHD